MSPRKAAGRFPNKENDMLISPRFSILILHLDPYLKVYGFMTQFTKVNDSTQRRATENTKSIVEIGSDPSTPQKPTCKKNPAPGNSAGGGLKLAENLSTRAKSLP